MFLNKFIDFYKKSVKDSLQIKNVPSIAIQYEVVCDIQEMTEFGKL